KMVICSLERIAVQKENIQLKTARRSLSTCNKYLLETQLQKTNKDSRELDSVFNSQSLDLPVITKSSVLQDIARRQKSVSTQYWGLDGFFVVGANPKQVMLEAHSPCTDSSPRNSGSSFPGDGKWVTERSLSEYADNSVVQSVLQSLLNRPSSGLDTQNRISPLILQWESYPGDDSRRPWSMNTLHRKLTGNCPPSPQPRPKSSPGPVLGVSTEISKHKCRGVTKQDEHLWEYIADEEALLTLGKELLSYTGPEKHYSLTSEDVTSSSRHPEKICRKSTDFHKNLELKDHSRVDSLRGWDESQMDDEEEILEDKHQVLALQ
ncbi:PREDICTED: zinc finger B-box domain-containing protein 1, partial [Tauraco erythrolophus]|uniref:zinc finger B-box domain-containing protein 1 n=1 Tax=Tauraco erythrolophus TaxID=121530 RepID=UPI000523941A